MNRMKSVLKSHFTKEAPIGSNQATGHFSLPILVTLFLLSIVFGCKKDEDANPYDGTWTFNLTYSNCSTVSYTSTTTHVVSSGQFAFSDIFTGDSCTQGSVPNYTFSGTIDKSGNLNATLSGPVIPGGATYASGICGTKTACSVSHNPYSSLILTR